MINRQESDMNNMRYRLPIVVLLVAGFFAAQLGARAAGVPRI